MRLTTQACDAWTATMHRRLDAIQTAILDLIDVGGAGHLPAGHVANPNGHGRCRVCGLDASAHERRPPTAAERRSHDRAHGNFYPTPKGSSRVPYHVSNPTHRQVERWETEVEEAVTALYGTMAEVVGIMYEFDLHPLAEDGTPAVCPEEPPTRRTSNGRLIVELHPVACRQATLQAVVWLGAACDVLIDHVRGAEDESGEMAAIRARYLQTLTGTLARRVGVAEGRTCTCGRPAPVGEGRKCGACGMLEMRSRTAS